MSPKKTKKDKKEVIDKKVNKKVIVRPKKKDLKETPAERRRKQYRKLQDKLDPDRERDEFRKYWIKTCKERRIPQALEDVVWRHLKAIKCNVKSKFDEGLKHFGY